MLTVARNDVVSLTSAQPARLAVADRKGQFPLAPAQFEGQVQPCRRCAKMLFVGRCPDRLLGKKNVTLITLRELIDSDPPVSYFLTGAAILVFELQCPCRRPRHLSLTIRREE
jgi:hypothetical protein